ncbi:aspartyl/glutamyl-tRNA(Asn/Gln) amidotransferase subunit A [Candidatus Koribacter versatilis Ellin345]|uniref:Glutamyl-tRNA(Gln) amidotransferase subunit A n=1 Tax=Koribacter versatilis (strain Ellin345) TaxID=204669 RepID=GATA_KORVE|nr:Asp-tRNA(Asn)/Glu-tRNA(Gln) amidotransferase subunit GatA [Candidatus Koribacter versatilis]Q1IUE4.1 RecName: Full=Glutamyl-tRNA(Gln) amidotransferase subunit A; Short=Glu-ADT subunit A [Candidatus Koribacter versatilis Ellin345]ABF39506.1 aspartyl/glutamyl-tRNA(Asn/Gln) amidotransferase subunit A [Candidatus Koribacter versatilis Ellin345]
MDINVLTIDATRIAIQERQATATAIAESFYKKIEAEDGEINAYLTLSRDRALAQAAKIDAIADRGDDLPRLAGLPVAIKDVISTKGVRTTAGSKILEEFIAPYDATVVQKLEAAGAVILGKTNCDEFAMGSSNENSAYGPVRNPRDKSRVPGGSSGGSAAVVAAGTAVTSLGSDTGGSIRQPASFCGVVGLMPTYGRVSRYGLIAFASSLDHIGPFAKDVKDAAIMLEVIAGRDPMDATSAEVAVPKYSDEIGKPVRGMKIGVAKEYFGEGLDPEVKASVEASIQNLAKAGAEIIEVSLPHTKYAIPTYYLVATAEASSNLARFDGVRYSHRSKEAKTLSEMYRKSRDEGFGAEVKRRIILGTYALSAGYYDAYYLKAQKVRTLLAQDFDEAFAKVDAIVTPTTPTPAFKLGEKADDPLAMYLADIFTVTADLVGIPGISVPCGSSKDGLPIGLQVFAKHFQEATMIRVAHAVEHALAAV